MRVSKVAVKAIWIVVLLKLVEKVNNQISEFGRMAGMNALQISLLQMLQQ
jgi:hypothetical protein